MLQKSGNSTRRRRKVPSEELKPCNGKRRRKSQSELKPSNGKRRRRKPQQSELKPCNSKRRRRKPQQSEFISILSCDLLLEIFIRVPDCRSLIRCSAVCKRWFSLINSDYCHRKLQQNPSLPCALIFRWAPGHLEAAKPMYEYLPENLQILRGIKTTNSSSSASYLDFLPSLKFRIFSTFHDLLLLSPEDDRFIGFIICNPLTRQWFQLPELPPQSPTWFTFGGIVCERRQEQELKLDQYRYRVMLFRFGRVHDAPNGRVEFNGMTFCSETRKWNKISFFFVGSALDCYPPVACNGMLHWLDGIVDGYIVHRIAAIDPFKDVKHPQFYRFIDFPLDLVRGHISSSIAKVRIGLVSGRLRISQLLPHIPERKNIGFVLKVWELNYSYNNKVDHGGDDDADDGLTWTWTLVHDVELKMFKGVHLFVLSFQPDNGNVLFLLYRHRHVYQYHIAEEKMEQIDKLPHNGEKSFSTTLRVYSLRHPFWPTQLPSV